MLDELYRKLGGTKEVAAMMSTANSPCAYENARRWRSQNFIPENQRNKFIAAAKKKGVLVTGLELAECKRNVNK